jgi:hypothetical protein
MAASNTDSGVTPLEIEIRDLPDEMSPAPLIGQSLREGAMRGSARRRRLQAAGGRKQSPLDAVVRTYRRQTGAAADRFSRGVAACLTNDDPGVRAQALLFFEAFPEAAGAELLVRLPSTRRHLFAGVPNPFAPSLDLEWQLLRSIGARILRRDPDALAVGYAAAVDPGRAQPLIAALTLTDPDWVVAHAEEIIAANPRVASTVLNCLQRSCHDVGSVGARIARLAARDPKFQECVELLILEDAVRRRIFAALQ